MMNRGSGNPAHYRRSHAEVDLRRVQHNFNAFKKLFSEGAFICPMVKANAYGHGDVEVARALRGAGARHLGVALVEEGERLRRAGDRDSLLVFGPVDGEAAEAAVRENLTVVASDWAHLEALDAAVSSLGASSVRIHLEFNTGMNRLGFKPSESNRLEAWVREHRSFLLEGVCTHLLRGNDAGAPGGESESQLEALANAIKAFASHSNLYVHALNSSGAVNLWKRISDRAELTTGASAQLGARPGIGIYGCEPGSDEEIDLGLKPVMTLKTQIIEVHRVQMGSRVSYGPTWTAAADSTVGVLPIGYADGYRRALSNRAQVLVRGRRCPQIGTVCMDYFMIDLTALELETETQVRLGEEVVLLGEQSNERIHPQEVAEWAETIPYEILTGISERVPRVYIR